MVATTAALPSVAARTGLEDGAAATAASVRPGEHAVDRQPGRERPDPVAQQQRERGVQQHVHAEVEGVGDVRVRRHLHGVEPERPAEVADGPARQAERDQRPRQPVALDRDRARGGQEHGAGLDGQVEDVGQARRHRQQSNREHHVRGEDERKGQRKHSGGPSLPESTDRRRACSVRVMATGSEIIVEELRRAGVEVCFGLPGVHNLALWEALRESPIRLVGVRHEQAAAYAADGYARATGRLGVALTTTGPGAANTLGRGRRGVGVAVAGPGDRHRHPVGAAAAGRVPRRAARDRRPGGDVRAGREVDARRAGRRRPSRRRPPPRWRPRVTAPTRPAYLEIATDLLAAEVPAGRSRAGDRRASSGGRRGRGRAARRGGAAAAVGRRRRARRGGGGAAARRAARGAGARRPTARPACCRPGIRAWSGSRRTSRPPAGCGTRPTSCSRSARTSTACRPRTSCSRSRRR